MVEIINLSKRFGRNTVLKNVSLKINRGEIYGLVGKNGAGKTTLLSIIAGLSKSTNGTIKCKVGTKIGFLPDVPEYYDTLTANEYIDFLLKYKNSEIRKNVLCMVHIDGNKKIRTMSRGMKQRVGIATVLINNPDIILLDEPTSALDPLGRQEVLEVLLNLKKAGKTIILSTHILNDMEKICDRVGFLVDGEIKKEVDIKNYRENCLKLQIKFDNNVEIENLMNEIDCKKVEDNFFRVQINNIMNQQEFFLKLSKIESRIIELKTEKVDLDEVFNEVCK